MSRKTRAEYEEIVARWRELPNSMGTVEETRLAGKDYEPCMFAKIVRELPHDAAIVCAAEMAAEAVCARGLMSLHVHGDNRARIQISISRPIDEQDAPAATDEQAAGAAS